MKSPEGPQYQENKLARAEADLRKALNIQKYESSLPSHLKIASVYKEMGDIMDALDNGDMETLGKYARAEITTAIGVSHLVQAYLDALER